MAATAMRALPLEAVFHIMPGCVGGIAQLGERLHGMQEVSGSIPLTSTNQQHPEGNTQSPSSRGLGHRPFTAVTGVRIPVGTPNKSKPPQGGLFVWEANGR